MLSPSLLVRKSLALTGVLLLLLSSGADAFGLHRCAHHDAVPQTTQQPSPHHHGHHADPGDQQDTEGCSCVGTCSLSSAALAPIAAPAQNIISPVIANVPIAATTVVRAAWQPHLLPYSTAPPASL